MAVKWPEIFLLRHGQTQWNVEGRYQGSKDSPLTELGRENAHTIGQILAKRFGGACPFELCVSPQPRAQESAKIIASCLAFSAVRSEPRLCEVSFGVWEGRLASEVRAKRPDLAEALKNRQAALYAPEGEPYEKVKERLIAWMESLREPVVAMSHGVLGRMLRGLYLDLPLADALVLPIPQDVVWHLSNGMAEKLELLPCEL